MPTIAQLQAEPWWSREIITVELHWLGDELCRRTGAPAYSIGTKGDENHLNGGHRSQEWIVNSGWCTNTRYTVQQGLTADQVRHIAALDRTPGAWGTAANRARMVVETSRLLTAARAGKLVGVTQIQGTINGTNTYGQNFPSLITTIPSDSHLDHWHVTFDRRYLHDAALMRRIADVVTIGEDEDMALADDRDFMYAAWRLEALTQLRKQIENGPAVVDAGGPVEVPFVIAFDGLLADVAALRADVAALETGGVDLDALAAKVADLLAARLKD